MTRRVVDERPVVAAPRPVAGALLGVCLLVVVGRGVFEAVASKQVGYAFQAVALVAVVVLSFGRGSVRRPAWSRMFVVLYLFLGAELLSAAYVTFTSATIEPWIYVVVMAVFAAMLWVYGAWDFPGLARANVMPWLATAGLVSVAVAVAQQRSLLLDVFPGSDLSSLGGVVRPAALTGSYLHYPLLISLLCFAFVQAGVSTRRRWYAIVALVFALAVGSSFSRSGMVILVGGLLCYTVLSSSLGRQIRLGIALVVAAVLAFFAFQDTAYWNRYVGGLDSEAAGNQNRITRWYAGLEYWVDSPFLIGGYTGQFTNVTGNLGGVDTGVLESGLVQQLVSFGLVGTILFYLLMVGVVLAVRPEHRWLRAGLVAAILQTLVYQSIEVVPFMALFALMPLVSRHIEARTSTERASGRDSGGHGPSRPSPVPVLGTGARHLAR